MASPSLPKGLRNLTTTSRLPNSHRCVLKYSRTSRLTRFLHTARFSVFLGTTSPSLGCPFPFGLIWIWKYSPAKDRLKLKTDENSSAFSKRYGLGNE